MSDPDFRALCEELMNEAIYLGSIPYDQAPNPELIAQARVALAQPEPPSLKEQALADLYEIYVSQPFPAGDKRFNRIRRALEAQPEPAAPTDEEILKLAAKELCYTFNESWFLTGRNCPDLDTDPCELLDFARAVLARWGTPAIQPVPVSFTSDLPLHITGELDDQGTCWNYHPINLHYCLCVPDPSVHTHWLPHWALPMPTPANNTRGSI